MSVAEDLDRYLPCLDKHGIEYFGYYVSPDGKVISFIQRELRIMRGGKNRKGYLHVTLRRDGVSHTESVHSLVARSYIGVPADMTLEVNHIDGVKSNLLYTNLEWTTGLDNHKHAKRIGLKANNQNGKWRPR